MRACIVYLALSLASYANAAPNPPRCRLIPGDPGWPTTADWSRFNQTVQGRLIKTTNFAEVCHTPNYDAAKCAAVQEQWNSPVYHDESSSSIMTAWSANNSCDAFTPTAQLCVPGNTVAYAVNASTPAHFTTAIHYAHTHNLRLNIRNSGHDYLARSTGKGALSIWTHNMKSIDFLTYTSKEYTGPAVRLGAGVQVEEAYRAVGARNMAIVGGSCESVGVAGGYTQGGGHGGLSTKYGLSADNVLEWTAVDGRGRLLTANRTHNHDLYWAMSGGGPSTYAAASSVILKLHPDPSVISSILLSFQRNQTTDAKFYAALTEYHNLNPQIIALGGLSTHEISPTQFRTNPLFLPDVPSSRAQALIQPYLNYLNTSGIPYNYTLLEFDNYYEYWNATVRPDPTRLVLDSQWGGWQISHSALANKTSDLTGAFKEMIEAGCASVSLGLDVSRDVDNGVAPHWRNTGLSVILSTPWPKNANLAEMRGRARTMTEKCVPAFRKVSPDTGAYMSEADVNQPDFKEAFYGSKYARLEEIKRKYDPEDVFYAKTTVGSDRWEQDGAGRLCRVRV